MNLDYSYNGNITTQQWRQVGTAGTNQNLLSYTYTYDNANRLSSAGFSGSGYSSTAFDASYGYDKNGNMTSIDRYNNSGVNYHDLTFTFTSNTNKIDLVFYNGDDFTVSYDANGNMSRNDYRDLTTASYDWRNLTKSVTTAGGSTIKHSYDGEGNRVTKDLVGGTTTHYICGAAGETIAIYENGSRKNINLLAGADVIGTWDGSQRRYFLKDHLGSIRTTVDQSGNVDGYDDYYAFGLVMPGRSSNSANPTDNYKFTGYEQDGEAGLNLYYAGARMYDPVIPRFLSIDPLADMFPEWTPYHYVHNNPLNLVDPTGMAACEDDDKVCKWWKGFMATVREIFEASDKVHINLDFGSDGKKGKKYTKEEQMIANAILQDQEDHGEKLEGVYNSMEYVPGADVYKSLYEGEYGEAALDAAMLLPAGRIGGILLKAGRTPVKGGFTALGRALQKHGNRSGSLFPKATGNAAEINSQAERIFFGIINNPNRTTVIRHHARFGNIMEIKMPSGQGVRFSSDGKTFIGFIE